MLDSMSCLTTLLHDDANAVCQVCCSILIAQLCMSWYALLGMTYKEQFFCLQGRQRHRAYTSEMQKMTAIGTFNSHPDVVHGLVSPSCEELIENL